VASEEPDDDVIDITHLAHDLSNKRALTGVTQLETAVVDEFRKRADKAIFVLWNSPLRRYVSIPMEMMENETFPRLANAKSLPDEVASFAHATVSVTDVVGPVREAASLPDRQDQESLPGRTSLSRRAKVCFKHAVRWLPGGLRRLSVRAIRIRLPEFDPSVEVPYFDPSDEIQHSADEKTAVARQLPRVEYKEGALQVPLIRGKRLFVFGQAWISNDRQLEDQIRFAQANKLALHCMIPDILYVTDMGSFPDETRRVRRRRLRRLLEAADTAMVISHRTGHSVREFLRTERIDCRVKVIQLGLPPSRKPPEGGSSARSSWRAGASGDYVTYVSSFNGRKNHAFLIEVWRELRRRLSESSNSEIPALVLAGTPQAHFGHFDDAGFQKQLADDGIHVVSGLDDEKLNALYRRCLFTVYPSCSEGWGFPPIESIAAGKVCVVSRTVPSVQETQSAALIKLDPDDYYGWVNTLEAFITRPAMRESFEEAAGLTQLPSWEGMVQDLIAGR
jgi:glycosyltransferase involved in cell wall biosynthesis